VIVEHWLLEFHVVIETTLKLEVDWSSLGWRVVEVRVVVLTLFTFAVSVALETCRITGTVFFRTFCLGTLTGFSLVINHHRFSTHRATFELEVALLPWGLLLVNIHLLYGLVPHYTPPF